MIRTAILTLASTTGDEIIARLRTDGLATETGIATIPMHDDGWLNSFLNRWLSNDKYLAIDETEVVTFGNELFGAIFQGNVSRGWDRLLTITGTNDDIRLLLNVEDPRLLSVPFELMHDGSGFVDPAKAHIFRVLSRPGREQSGFKPIRRLAVLLAEPEGPETPSWGRDKHRADIEQVFGSLTDPNNKKIAVEFIDPPTLSNLSTMFDRAHHEGRFYDALYIVAHGKASEGGEAKLAFEDDDKQSIEIPASTLSERLKVNPGLFITLAACSSSVTTLDNPYAGFAQSLMENAQAGAVLAMQRDALVSATLPITQTLFRELVAGKLPEAAVIRARTSEAERHKASVPILFTQVQGPESERARRLGNLLNLDPSQFTRLDIVVPCFKMGLLSEDYNKRVSEGRSYPVHEDGYHYRNETIARPDLSAAWSVLELFQEAWAGLKIEPRVRWVSPEEYRNIGGSADATASHVICVGSRSQTLLPAVFQKSGRFKFDYSDKRSKWRLTDELSNRTFETVAPQDHSSRLEKDYLLIEKLSIGKQTYVVLAGFMDDATALAGEKLREDWEKYQLRYGGQPFQRLYEWETALGRSGVYLKDVMERSIPHEKPQDN